MAAFEYRQAQEVHHAFGAHGVRYLFLGKSGAILLGFPDTTQDADLFVEKSAANGAALVSALVELGFGLSESEAADIVRGKDFVQLKNAPFDLDLIFAPDGIERFEDAWNAAWKAMAFRFATRTTLLPARKRRTARRTASPWTGWKPSAITGRTRTHEVYLYSSSGGQEQTRFRSP